MHTPNTPARLARHMVAIAALLAGIGAASAQPAPGTAPGAGPGPRHAMMDPAQRTQRFEQRMAELKAKLALTPAQEAAWTSFANALRPSANMPARPDRDAIARMSTPDRIDHMRALRTQRIAEMDRKADATKAFYAQLSAEQKKTFDDASLRLMGGRGGHGGPGGHGGGWGHAPRG